MNALPNSNINQRRWKWFILLRIKLIISTRIFSLDIIFTKHIKLHCSILFMHWSCCDCCWPILNDVYDEVVKMAKVKSLCLINLFGKSSKVSVSNKANNVINHHRISTGGLELELWCILPHAQRYKIFYWSFNK